jgi:transcriptional regulator with XRE-family HTH domain
MVSVTDCQTVGQRLRWVREVRLGLSSTYKAEAFLKSLPPEQQPKAKSFGAVARYEKDQRVPGSDYLRAWAGAGDVSLEWLSMGEGTPDAPPPGPDYADGVRFALSKLEETVEALRTTLGDEAVDTESTEASGSLILSGGGPSLEAGPFVEGRIRRALVVSEERAEAFSAVEKDLHEMRTKEILSDDDWAYWIAFRRGAILSGGYDAELDVLDPKLSESESEAG